VFVHDDEGVITVFAGSGSTYLNDMIQFHTRDDEDED
jgi:hypothetical protein